MLNYLRSVERTLVMDTVGLRMFEGDLVRNMQDTGWMTAARGGDGGPASHHYVYNTPVDYKVQYIMTFQLFFMWLLWIMTLSSTPAVVCQVRCAEFMEFPEVENLHDYYSTDGRFIHTQDQRGLYIIYDVALVDLKELEDSLLLTASRFIQMSRGQGRCSCNFMFCLWMWPLVYTETGRSDVFLFW